MSTTSPHPRRAQLTQAQLIQARMTQATGAAHRGFTLVELLMVIVIIGILASLLLVAVGSAMTKAREAQITSEITNLQIAMTSYKQDNGQFPPTMCLCAGESEENRQQRILRHLRKRFPRLVANDYAAMRQYVIDNYGPDMDHLDAAESIVFWLGGFPDKLEKLQGFSTDPSQPFKPTGSRTTMLFDFTDTRLTDVDQDGWWEYVPDGTSSVGDQMPPYVYFDANSYGLTAEYPSLPPGTDPPPIGPNDAPYGGGGLGAQWGGLRPYTTDSAIDVNTGIPTHFHESSSFQIISSGLDSIYGVQQVWRETTNRTGWNEFDEDNLTNFHGARLGTLPE